MTTSLPLEWIIWIFFLAYFPSLFSVKTRLCSEPRPEDNQGQKKSTKVRESSQARYLREEHLSRKDHRVWVQNRVLAPALWSCKPSEPPCILHRVTMRMKWDCLCKRNVLLFLVDQGPPAQTSQIFGSWLPFQPRICLSVPPHTHGALVLENCWSSQLSSLPLLALPWMAFPVPCAWPAFTDESIHSTDGCLLSIHCVPITVTGAGDTVVN